MPRSISTTGKRTRSGAVFSSSRRNSPSSDRPAFFSAHIPIVVLMAGRKRNAAEYLDYWKADAERRGFLVVAPEFTESQYPHTHEYSYGAMRAADGGIRPRRSEE